MNDDKHYKIEFGGFFSLLTVALIILKILGIINTSWVWVLAPMWIPFCILLLILLIIILVTR